MIKKKQYDIVIGFKDQNVKKEIITPYEVIKIIEPFLCKNTIHFSIIQTHGAYSYSNTELVFERSIILRLIDCNPKIVKMMAKSLKMYLNQEKVDVSDKEIEVEYI